MISLIDFLIVTLLALNIYVQWFRLNRLTKIVNYQGQVIYAMATGAEIIVTEEEEDE